MKKIIVLFIALVLALPLVLGSCSSKEKTIADIKAAGTITMATCTGFEPFEMLVDGKFVGIDFEIAEAIAKKLGVKLEVADIDFDVIVDSIQSGKYDLGIAGMTANAKRLKNVNFSTNYFKASQSIIVTADSTIATKDDLKEKTIGVQKGTTGETFCEEKGYKFQSYDNGADACVALTSGKIDAVVIDNFPAKQHVQESNGAIKLLDEALTAETYAIAIKKENKELVELVNEVLKELKDSGELAAMFAKYNIVVDAD